MRANLGVERHHERRELVVVHARNLVVEDQPLVEQGQLAPRRRVRLHAAVEAAGFASRAQQRQQHLRDGREEQQPVAAIGAADVGRRQAHAEAEVLLSRNVSSIVKRRP